ncbi:MAG TPA: hypothetical protein VHW01_07265 [Polyangiaceae bacterium]|jgi:hypothetical protein|nr:hypothetical protein [Polyangiaceae bacterium]
MSHQQPATVDILALHDHANARELRERIGSTAAGLILGGAAAFSSRPRSATRALLGAAGALLVARGLSGLSVRQISTFVTNLFAQRKDLEKRFNDGEYDIVDAASFDSFPASDPPSYSPGAS